MTIYPNPSQNNVHIITPENKKGDVNITNSMGQIIYTEEIKAPYTDINITHWANGLYLIKWQGEDGTVLTNKLIKD
jgi:Secretion system C-terminal sorting domain